MKLNNCIFCGVPLALPSLQRPHSRTKEHVYARWFRDNVVNKKIKMFTSDGTLATLHEQKPLRAFVNPSVCGSCNNGWMSNLEEEAERVFEKLNTGTDVRLLTQGEVETLARWTGKTAIVLGFVTPTPAIVPEEIRRSLLPGSPKLPQMRVFYALIRADKTLEGAYLQLGYGSELGLLGSQSAPGHRFTLCAYNHLLTVDFPPMLAGLLYDLTESCSAQIWPNFLPAGTANLDLPPTPSVEQVLHSVCSSVKVAFDIGALHV